MTAVQWLIDKIFGEHTKEWKEEIQQALEMEKKQIEDAKKEGYDFATSEAIKEINKNYKP